MRKLMACLVALVATSAANAAVISTLGAWNGSNSVTPFGVADTAVYGQTFVAPTDNVMNSFTFNLRRISGANTLTFAPYVMAWNGTQATGPVLFQGPLQTLPASATSFGAITVNTGNLALVSGQQYVAFFSVLNDAPTYPTLYSSQSAGNLAGYGLVGNDYTSGQFVFLNTFTSGTSNFSGVTSTPWSNFGGSDLAFQMNFSAAAVPEPISLVVFGGLLVGGGLVARKRLLAKKAVA